MSLLFSGAPPPPWPCPPGPPPWPQGPPPHVGEPTPLFPTKPVDPPPASLPPSLPSSQESVAEGAKEDSAPQNDADRPPGVKGHRSLFLPKSPPTD